MAKLTADQIRKCKAIVDKCYWQVQEARSYRYQYRERTMVRYFESATLSNDIFMTLLEYLRTQDYVIEISLHNKLHKFDEVWYATDAWYQTLDGDKDEANGLKRVRIYQELYCPPPDSTTGDGPYIVEDGVFYKTTHEYFWNVRYIKQLNKSGSGIRYKITGFTRDKDTGLFNYCLEKIEEVQVQEAVTETRTERSRSVKTTVNRHVKDPLPELNLPAGTSVRNEKTEGGIWNTRKEVTARPTIDTVTQQSCEKTALEHEHETVTSLAQEPTGELEADDVLDVTVGEGEGAYETKRINSKSIVYGEDGTIRQQEREKTAVPWMQILKWRDSSKEHNLIVFRNQKELPDIQQFVTEEQHAELNAAVNPERGEDVTDDAWAEIQAEAEKIKAVNEAYPWVGRGSSISISVNQYGLLDGTIKIENWTTISSGSSSGGWHHSKNEEIQLTTKLPGGMTETRNYKLIHTLWRGDPSWIAQNFMQHGQVIADLKLKSTYSGSHAETWELVEIK